MGSWAKRRYRNSFIHQTQCMRHSKTCSGGFHENSTDGSVVVALSLWAAVAFLAAELHAQVLTEAVSSAPDAVESASDSYALWLATGNTNALAESLAALQARLGEADAGAKSDGSQKAGDNTPTTTSTPGAPTMASRAARS